MKRIITPILIILCLTAAASLAGFFFTHKHETPAAPKDGISVTLTIQYPEKAKKKDVIRVQKTEFSVEKDTSVLDALQLYGKLEDLPVSVDTTRDEVDGIGGVENGAVAKGSVWKFHLNGGALRTDPARATLKAGDSITWVFTVPKKAEKANGTGAAGADAKD